MDLTNLEDFDLGHILQELHLLVMKHKAYSESYIEIDELISAVDRFGRIYVTSK